MTLRTYDSRPARAHDPLTDAEVAGLISVAGDPLRKDPAAAVHLLTRIEATMRAHKEQVAQLHRDLDTLRLSTQRRGTPLQAAVDALANLTDAQRTQVFDITTQRAAAQIEAAQAEVDRMRMAARSELSRIRLALSRALDTPDLPEATVRELQAALHALPTPGIAAGIPQHGPDAKAEFVPPWQASTAPALPAETAPALPADTAVAPAPDPVPDPDPVPAPAPAVAGVPGGPLPVTFAMLEPTPDEPGYQLQAFYGADCVASVDISADNHTAAGLYVDPPWRRHGIATALMDAARAAFADLRVGPTSGEAMAFLGAYAARSNWPS